MHSNLMCHCHTLHFCSNIVPENAESLRDRIVVVRRGECTFVDKARRAEAAGAWAVIVVDNAAESTSKDQPIFAMSGDGKDDVTISVVFLYKLEGDVLAEAHRRNPTMEVRAIFVSGQTDAECETNNISEFAITTGHHYADVGTETTHCETSRGHTKGKLNRYRAVLPVVCELHTQTM